jgi:hypothetical protein
LIKKSFSDSEREKKVEPQSLIGAKANLNLILVHIPIEKKKHISCAPLRD